jgi:Ca-activated chloride channel family protein
MLQDEDFENDSVDAGEIGSGHCVTALYEIIAAGSGEEVPSSSLKYQEARTVSSSELATVSLRYKEPDGAESKLASSAVLPMAPGEANSDNFRWASACAQAALLLRRSENAAQASWDSVLELASPLSGLDAYRADFIEFANSVKGEAL